MLSFSKFHFLTFSLVGQYTDYKRVITNQQPIVNDDDMIQPFKVCIKGYIIEYLHKGRGTRVDKFGTRFCLMIYQHYLLKTALKTRQYPNIVMSIPCFVGYPLSVKCVCNTSWVPQSDDVSTRVKKKMVRLTTQTCLTDMMLIQIIYQH